jgi:hypothetical protein
MEVHYATAVVRAGIDDRGFCSHSNDARSKIVKQHRHYHHRHYHAVVIEHR